MFQINFIKNQESLQILEVSLFRAVGNLSTSKNQENTADLSTEILSSIAMSNICLNLHSK